MLINKEVIIKKKYISYRVKLRGHYPPEAPIRKFTFFAFFLIGAFEG